MQCLCVPLNFSLLLRIPFPLTFFNHPVCTCCRGCIQFLLPSIVHQIDYFFPAIVPDKTSQFTHPVCSRSLHPSVWNSYVPNTRCSHALLHCSPVRACHGMLAEYTPSSPPDTFGIPLLHGIFPHIDFGSVSEVLGPPEAYFCKYIYKTALL